MDHADSNQLDEHKISSTTSDPKLNYEPNVNISKNEKNLKHDEKVDFLLKSESSVPEKSTKLNDYENVKMSTTQTTENYEFKQENKPVKKLRRTSTSSGINVLKNLPRVNCPENIIFCVDHSSELFASQFKSSLKTGSHSAMETVIKAICHYMKSKSLIDNRHQYSLLLLNDNVQHITGLNRHHEEIFLVLKDLAKVHKKEKNNHPIQNNPIDLTSLFGIINKHAQVPKPPTKGGVVPHNIVHVIMIYGRSHSSFTIDKSNNDFQYLQSHPFFFFDAIYLHDKILDDNMVLENFNNICSLDENGNSHIYEVDFSMNMAVLFNAMSKLLAHPLQRPLQKDKIISYEL